MEGVLAPDTLAMPSRVTSKCVVLAISMMMCCSQGVESDQCDAFGRSFEKKELVTVDVKSTVADGLAVSTVGLRSFNTALPNVDRAVTVR